VEKTGIFDVRQRLQGVFFVYKHDKISKESQKEKDIIMA